MGGVVLPVSPSIRCTEIKSFGGGECKMQSARTLIGALRVATMQLEDRSPTNRAQVHLWQQDSGRNLSLAHRDWCCDITIASIAGVMLRCRIASQHVWLQCPWCCLTILTLYDGLFSAGIY